MLVRRWAALCAELASTHSLDPMAVWAEHTAAQTTASDGPNPTGLGGWRYYFRPEDEAAIYPARLLGLEEGETVTVMGTPAIKIEVEGGVRIPHSPLCCRPLPVASQRSPRAARSQVVVARRGRRSPRDYRRCSSAR